MRMGTSCLPYTAKNVPSPSFSLLQLSAPSQPFKLFCSIHGGAGVSVSEPQITCARILVAKPGSAQLLVIHI
eukprot:790840-Pelagomonas_calceolata.AAC.6